MRFSQKLNAKLGEFQVCFVPLSLLRGPVLIHSGIGSGSGTGIGPTSGSGSGWMGGVTSGSVPGYGSGSGAGPGGPGIGGVIEDSRRMCFFNGIMCMGCVGGGARPVIRGDLHGSKVHLNAPEMAKHALSERKRKGLFSRALEAGSAEFRVRLK